MPRAQAGGAAAMFGDTMVIAGGTAWEDGVKLWLADVQLFDARADRWRTGPALPEHLAYGPFAQSGAALEIYGGAGSASGAPSRAIWRIDASLGKWTRVGDTPADHLLGRAARVGRRVFLFGGCSDVADLTRCSDAVWMREDGGIWRQVAKLPGGAVALSAAAVLQGRVYLFGGCAMPEAGKLFNRAEAWAFDPVSLRFYRLRDLPAANRGLTAGVLNGRILLFGGYTGGGFTAEVWSFDPASDSYAAQTPMPAAMTSAEFVPRGSVLWAAGGEDRMKHRSALTFAVSAAAAGAAR